MTAVVRFWLNDNGEGNSRISCCIKNMLRITKPTVMQKIKTRCLLLLLVDDPATSVIEDGLLPLGALEVFIATMIFSLAILVSSNYDLT